METILSPAEHVASSLIAYRKQEALQACFVGDETAVSGIINPNPSLGSANFRQIGQLTLDAVIRRHAVARESLKIQRDGAVGKRQPDCLSNDMIYETSAPSRLAANERLLREAAIIARFLDEPCDESFTDVYKLFTPRLVAFYRARNCAPSLSEDLAQLVMLTVHRKADQIRDRALFRAWLFRIAHNALCHHYGRQAREVEIVYVEDSIDRLTGVSAQPGPPAFEFMHWIGFLNPREREVMTLRFVEEWEYHEIAAAKNIPIGTVQWIVFNAKKKLAPRLTAINQGVRPAGNQPKPERKAA